MERHIRKNILKDLKKKMVFITGPRQVGKTYLAKEIMTEYQKPQYLNFDNLSDARIILSASWPEGSDLLVLDEVHKMKSWKKYLKGVFDSKPDNQHILITGSSRMDTFRQSGESLAGRYFHHRLLPFSVKEFALKRSAFEKLELLIKLGGFPEPLLSSSEEQAARWRNQYFTGIIREDIVEFGRIQELRSMKYLLETLRERVGSPVSYSAVARDLQLSPNSVKKYIDILEALYIVFRVYPFSKKISRSILKEPKVYLYDTGYVKTDKGRALENAVAVCLKKHVNYLVDSKGAALNLNYLRTKDGQEIDFALTKEDVPASLIEVKLSDSSVSPGLRYFSEKFPEAESLQLVHDLRKEEHRGRVRIVSASKWLEGLSA